MIILHPYDLSYVIFCGAFIHSRAHITLYDYVILIFEHDNFSFLRSILCFLFWGYFIYSWAHITMHGHVILIFEHDYSSFLRSILYFLFFFWGGHFIYSVAHMTMYGHIYNFLSMIIFHSYDLFYVIFCGRLSSTPGHISPCMTMWY